MPVWDRVAEVFWRPAGSDDVPKHASLPPFAFRRERSEDAPRQRLSAGAAGAASHHNEAAMPMTIPSTARMTVPSSARSPSPPTTVRQLSQKPAAVDEEVGGRIVAGRVAQLEAAVIQERQRANQKEEELRALNQLVSKLENALEVQQTEQDRIATLEQALSQRHGDEADKVEKLLLAVAGEKQLAEDRATELANVKAQLAEELSKHRGTNNWLAEKEKQLKDTQFKLDDEEAARLRLEHQVLEKDKELRDIQQQLAEELTKREEATGQLAEFRRQYTSDDGGARYASKSIEKEREICELQQQLAEELSKRREVQYQNLHNIEKLLEVQQQLAHERATNGQSLVLSASRAPIHLSVPEDTSDADAVSITPPGTSLTASARHVRSAVGNSMHPWQGMEAETTGTPLMPAPNQGLVMHQPLSGQSRPRVWIASPMTGGQHVPYQSLMSSSSHAAGHAPGTGQLSDVQSRLARGSKTFT